MMRQRLSLLLLALCLSTALYGQAGFVYYDVDRLYDTIPSPFYNDNDYTPQGRYRWSGERYRAKVQDIAALIDSLAQPIVALYGVENEQVVRDLTTALKGDYTFLHRTLNTLDGMDFALLYYGDRLIPYACHTARRTLHVEATIDRDTVSILLSADRATLTAMLQDEQERHPHRRFLVAGPLQGFNASGYRLIDRMERAARSGHGTRHRSSGWQMRDRIFTSPEIGSEAGEVFIRCWLLDPESGTPLPTYRDGRYRGGRSINLPIWCRTNR